MTTESGAQLERKVQRLAKQLQKLRNSRQVESVCAAGKAVVDVLFGGVDAWRQRTKNDLAYARLETLCGLPMTPVELYRAVRIYELCERVPSVLQMRNLRLSHLLVVLAVEASAQLEILQLADEQSWTVRQLRFAVQNRRFPEPATGRPRVPPILKTLGQLLASDKVFDGTDSLLALSHREAKTLLETCQRARLGIERAERNLKHVVAGRIRKRVLLVDASRAFTLRAQTQLRRQGCNVRVAHSVTEAYSAIESETTCAIIDPILPDGCGIELSQRLRDSVPSLRLVFVVDHHVETARIPPPDAVTVYKTSGLLALRVAVATAIDDAEPLVKMA